MSKQYTAGPNFLIVGTMKSGTSSLAVSLQKHPSINIPQKEIHFFDSNYQRGFNWYENFFNQTSYNKISGEATPTYSFLPHIPYLVHQAYPNVKLVWIFRDPVKRTFSNYLHYLKKGDESRSFKSAINDELKGKEQNIFKHYIARSFYSEQIYRWSCFFSTDQMYYMYFEKLKENYENEIIRLQDFLGIEKNKVENELPHSNKTRLPKGEASFRILRKVLGNTKLFSKIRGKIWPHHDILPSMTQEESELLKSVFKLHNRQLEEITGMDLKSLWGY